MKSDLCNCPVIIKSLDLIDIQQIYETISKTKQNVEQMYENTLDQYRLVRCI